MKTISRYIMTLALLLTAVTGAWAGVTPVSVAGNWLNSQWDPTTNQMAYKDGVYSITFSNMPAGQNYEFKFALNNSWDVSYGYSSTTAVELNKTLEIATQSGVDTNIKFDLAEACDVTISFNLTEPRTFMISTSGLVIGEDDKAPIKVAYNTAKTTASFDMPTNDVDVSYELVRDMSVKMQAQVGDDPAKQPRYRVQWNGERWVPADLDNEQVMALFSVNDLIENTTLDPENYLVSIYAIDTEGNPTGDAMNFKTFTFAPGRYCVTASPNTLLEEPVPYEGTTAPSNIFELIQGYQIVIPAGEYATFYHNEKLRIEDTDAELYTIANVTATEAVLSEKMTVAPSETPLLVYNAGSETKTFLLMPTDDEASEALVAAEFRGTLAAKDMPASSTNMDYYVCTGKAFTWVRDAGQIAANRCWLQIGSGNQPANTRASSRAITRGIGGIDGTTGIDTIDNEQFANDIYYDLNGRKVTNPKRGGIYIHNGKKVIVR